MKVSQCYQFSALTSNVFGGKDLETVDWVKKLAYRTEKICIAEMAETGAKRS